jgi:hypothetical protein
MRETLLMRSHAQRKSLPQRLKPSPSFDSLFPGVLGSVKIGRDAILLQPSLRDLIILHDVPRTNVLG